MSRVSIIMPCVAGNFVMSRICHDAIESCSKTCNARVWLYDNGPDLCLESNGLRGEISCHAGYCDYKYTYIPGPFNQAAIFNRGIDDSAADDSEFIFFANCDLIFFPGWLDNLLALWDKRPDYACLAPYSYSAIHKGLCYRQDWTPQNVIIPCDHPSGWLYGIRRSDGFRHDERFAYWNVDDNFHWYLKSKNKQAGVCYNSRVDHLADAVKTHAPENFGFDLSSHITQSDSAFRKKWGLS